MAFRTWEQVQKPVQLSVSTASVQCNHYWGLKYRTPHLCSPDEADLLSSPPASVRRMLAYCLLRVKAGGDKGQLPMVPHPNSHYCRAHYQGVVPELAYDPHLTEEKLEHRVVP